MFKNYPEDMFINVSRSQIATLVADYVNLYAVGGQKVTEGVHSCPKCRQTRVTANEKQTRSGDEGFTTFYACSDCGHAWREN